MPPTEKTKMPLVMHPYSGPDLLWLIPIKRLPLNTARSGVELISDCSKCGQKRFTFKRDGLIIDASDWHGERIFYIEQFGKSGAIFVTEDSLNAIAKEGIKNLYPRLAGSIG